MPLGIYDEPPPPLIPFITATEIDDSKASSAAAWITQRANDAAQCYVRLPFP